MEVPQMIEKYTELIKANNLHDDSMLGKIFKKHNMQSTIPLVTSLGNYLDHLNELRDNVLLQRIAENYGEVDNNDNEWYGIEQIARREV